MAPMRLSNTSARAEDGVSSCPPIPLPRTRNSSRPRAWEILAHVLRETTTDLTLGGGPRMMGRSPVGCDPFSRRAPSSQGGPGGQAAVVPAKDFKRRMVVEIDGAPHMIEQIQVQTPSARGAATLYKIKARNL